MIGHSANHGGPRSDQVVVCQYTAKPGCEEELEGLLRSHWETLSRLGLATDEPARLLKGLGTDPDSHGAKGKYMEIFSWKSHESMGLAHQMPEVMQIWEKIGACCSFMDSPSYARM